ncbi:hypothetical protein HNO88_001055 [Novosphingobium chloroacetimidivorans]|uniref:Uncharacterized protein n=1 Tax=Novosphingobium chloroacetimidivorans TaxID=1428314 RepID=A0A7W7K7M4_9SPHN|nr:hypothetical protein [Novosphingobium chloroacetimidivorans]MBB4857744.1 hypothetical protein [Novosphingobium chloroacetimidivorans]
MDMAFDLDGGGLAADAGVQALPVVHPRWPDLLARLVASREASASLAKGIRTETIAMRGSFDDFAAACLAAFPVRHRSVNPNDLGNRKSGEAIASAVAGLTRSGGRG